MDLFVIRHAEAVEPEAADSDDVRPLTSRGRKRFQAVVKMLGRLDVRFDRVLHSPWLRAVETADLLAPLIDGETEVTPLLAAEPSPSLLARIDGDRVAIVGHQPWLGDTVAWLVMADRTSGPRFPFDKGGVVWLQGEPLPGGMSVRAVLPGSVARALV